MELSCQHMARARARAAKRPAATAAARATLVLCPAAGGQPRPAPVARLRRAVSGPTPPNVTQDPDGSGEPGAPGGGSGGSAVLDKIEASLGTLVMQQQTLAARMSRLEKRLHNNDGGRPLGSSAVHLREMISRPRQMTASADATLAEAPLPSIALVSTVSDDLERRSDADQARDSTASDVASQRGASVE
eukprot:COSAG04_NODE_4816_length_1881_cov_0.970819_1_plen_189_part_00